MYDVSILVFYRAQHEDAARSGRKTKEIRENIANSRNAFCKSPVYRYQVPKKPRTLSGLQMPSWKNRKEIVWSCINPRNL
jgi:hypothetical protein